MKDTNQCATTGFRRIFTYPLIRHTDMPDGMKAETMQLCVAACQSNMMNNQNAARIIKEAMDRRFGASWHVVVGEQFGFEITHEVSNLLYMFFGGNLAICVWKCT